MSEHTLHLLIVDDEESIRKPLADHLSTIYHYDVDTAGDGQEALRLIYKFQGHYDVALIDQVLEGDISGLDLLKEIKNQYSEIQVIVFTGWGMKQEEGINILNQGAYRYIAKPFNLEELALTIRFAAEQRQIHREHEYLSSLVQVSSELTQTTDLEKQLALVWNYVKDKLETPTFFIALYDSTNDTLQFHQSYDEGEPDPLPYRHLGDDSSQWGIAGHIVKMKQEEAWLTREESEKRWQDLGIKPLISGKGFSEAGICFPLQIGDEILGVISVQSYQPQAFDRAFLNAVRTLGGQLAPAIKNARLFSTLEKTSSHLEGLVEGSLDAAIFIDIDRRITVFNKQAEQMLGYSAEEMIGHTVTKLYSDVNQAKMIWNQIDQQSKIVSHEVMLKHKDGIEIPTLLSAVSVKGSEGNIIGQAGFVRDLRQIHLLEERLRALIGAGRAISGLIETDEILQHIVESAIAAFPTTEKGSIHLYDEKTERLYIKASYGYDPIVAEAVTLKIGEGFAGWVYEHGVSIVSGNVQVDQRFKAFNYPEMRKQRSMICAPLIVKGKVIGTLSLDNLTTYDAFRTDDVELLSSFAGQAANAIENSGLYKELSRALQQVTRARNTAQAVAEVTALEELPGTLDSIVRGTQNTLGCDVVTLYTYDQEHDEFDFPPTMIGVNEKDKVLDFGFVAKDSVPYKIIERDDLYVAEDTASDPLLGSPFSMREGTKSAIGVPLIAGGRKVGVLFVNYKTYHNFTDEDLTNVKLFGHQAAVAIENARLYNAAKQRADNLGAILQVSQTVISSLDLDHILTAACQAVVELLKVDHSGLVLFDQNLTIGRVCAEYPEIGTMGVEFPLRGVPAEEQLIETKKPLMVPDVMSEPGFDPVRDVLTKLGTSSILIIPIMNQEQIIGSFGLDVMKHKRVFTDEEIELCTIFAAQAAVTIRNARLLADISRRNNQLQTITDISKSISTLLDLEKLMDQAVNVIRDRFSLYYAGLFLIDESRENAVLRAGSGEVGQIMLKDGHKLAIDGQSMIGWSIANAQARITSNVTEDTIHYYNFHLPETRSEMALPLIIHNECIGAITIQSNKKAAFSKDDIVVLQTMTDQLAIAVENALRYKELASTKNTLAARTAMAWTGMASSTWLHAVGTQAITIREQIQLLRGDLKKSSSLDSINRRLVTIDRLANEILKKPITPPLDVEESYQSLSINELVEERTKQLWTDEPYKNVSLELDLKLENAATVRAEVEWLRRALDILINNAVGATAGLGNRKIIISTGYKENWTQIRIVDNGIGIPRKIRDRIFVEPIKKEQGEKGSGMGLLFAQMIVQTFRGSISCYKTGPKGTEMIVLLPLESKLL